MIGPPPPPPGSDELPAWRDEGLAVERTALAYTRSTLALAALAALAVNLGVRKGAWGVVVPLVLLLVFAAAVTWRLGRWGYEGRSRGLRVDPRARALRALAAATALVGVGTAALVVVTVL